MKKLLISLAILSSTLLAIEPAQAQVGQNNVAGSILFGNGQTSIGVDSRFGLTDNFSVRPSIYFPNNTTTFGAAITYDFPSVDTERRLTPFGGVGVRFNSGSNNSNTTAYLTAGADYSLDSTFILKANLNVPISSSDSTNVAVGAGITF
jgi:opacity protein-like surface antigen